MLSRKIHMRKTHMRTAQRIHVSLAGIILLASSLFLGCGDDNDDISEFKEKHGTLQRLVVDPSRSA